MKAIQKLTAFITKAFTAIFGKMIGRALAGIVNGFINLLTFPVHVAYYSSQGDWKGLFKYLGQVVGLFRLFDGRLPPAIESEVNTLLSLLAKSS